ncbi:MAG: CFI-box-CTERM domain-containing protein [Rugosibacter sp.]
MNKNELATALTRLRMARLAESQGHSAEQARAIADDTLRQGGVSGLKAMATPEGSIVTIVESHLQHIAKRCVELGGPDHFTQANNEAIAAIEAHRSQFGAKGLPSYPKDIDDYVYYRINLEIQDQFGCNADSMGLDRQTTKMLTHTAKANLTKMMRGEPSGSGSKSCFVATACFGSPDTEIVVTLRRYRESVLKKSTVGRFSIYWYYKLSPPIANFIANHSYIKEIVQRALVRLAKKLSTKHGL